MTIKLYQEFAPDPVLAQQWNDPGSFIISDDFRPMIIEKDKQMYISEWGHYTPILPGYFIVKELHSYISYTPEQFHAVYQDI